MSRKLTYDPQHDYYQVLGIEPHTPADELRQAYRRAVRQIHPDLHPELGEQGTEQLQVINEAYSVLNNPALRREYDRLRWPHAPNQPQETAARPAYKSPFTSTAYDPNRPWWEQAAAPTRSHSERISPDPGSIVPTQPYWLQVSLWLRARGWVRLQHGWLTLVGLWRSPYAGVLSVLSVVLALNIAFIVYAFLTPGGGTNWFADLRHSIKSADEILTSDSTADSIPREDFELYGDCPERVEITSPQPDKLIKSSFAVTGTVNPESMWNYTVRLGYLERPVTAASVPTQWETVRAPDPDQTLPDIVESGLLVEEIAMRERLDGFYVISVEVQLQNGTRLPACNRVIQYREP
ncbi:MAG TPA: J domain-containing protein [Phototrophicaceae bacterium]|nr:J domain-containing protein [Phototrophicaceae bacterium]HEX3049780.1 J domain-containing protein [Aggregatilineaceae bacterium]